MIENHTAVSASPQPETQNPLSRMLRFLIRMTSALVIGIALGIFHCAWHLAFFLLCMFRPVVNVLVLGGVIMLPVSFAAFVKPETANGMPFWAILLMAVGFISFAMGYSKFVEWFAPPGEADPFERYRRRDW
ncbi:hypothetical protein [Pararhizobium polonicum]|nr:hypothetical protein [Pararhizobium polonicum]